MTTAGTASELTRAELDDENVSILPRREALALLNVNALLGTNLSLALNAVTTNSSATAVAVQGIYVFQS